MISFDNLVLDSQTPIYQQIVLFIKRGIASGEIENGCELPSRRVLSATLGVNPNTIQKAYKILEDEGLIVSQLGSKSLIEISESTCEKIKQELTSEDALNAVNAFKMAGLTLAEATNLIKKYWEAD